MLGKCQAWSSANNLPDAAPNWIMSFWTQNVAEDSTQVGKWPLCTWQNLSRAGANESYSALTAETNTQLHCTLQSVVLRHEEWPCKDSIHARKVQKLPFSASACHGAPTSNTGAEPGLTRGHCGASQSMAELICNLDIQTTDSWEFTSPLRSSLHFSTLPIYRWIWLFSGVLPVKASQWNIVSAK